MNLVQTNLTETLLNRASISLKEAYRDHGIEAVWDGLRKRTSGPKNI